MPRNLRMACVWLLNMNRMETSKLPSAYDIMKMGFNFFGEDRIMAGMVEMHVEEFGEILLEYKFGSLNEASEMLAFLKDFFPSATFLIQPLRQ